VRALTSGASTVVDVGVHAMEQSTKELDVTATAGAERIKLLTRLGEIGAEAADTLRGVGLGPGNALIGPLASARTKFARQLHKARRAMADVRDASAGIGEMALGPSRYLLLAANNSEMRSGSGMLLSAGVLATLGGNFSLGPMTSVTDLAPPPGTVQVTGDYQARGGGWTRRPTGAISRSRPSSTRRARWPRGCGRRRPARTSTACSRSTRSRYGPS
jgi:hypothetical protein